MLILRLKRTTLPWFFNKPEDNHKETNWWRQKWRSKVSTERVNRKKHDTTNWHDLWRNFFVCQCKHSYSLVSEQSSVWFWFSLSKLSVPSYLVQFQLQALKANLHMYCTFFKSSHSKKITTWTSNFWYF